MKGTSHAAELCLQVAQGEANPFWILEGAQECIGALLGALKGDGYEIPKRTYVGESAGEVGSVLYYVTGLESKVQRLFNLCDALLPDLYLASEGDDEALARLRPHLEAIERQHQEHWESL